MRARRFYLSECNYYLVANYMLMSSRDLERVDLVYGVCFFKIRLIVSLSIHNGTSLTLLAGPLEGLEKNGQKWQI